MASTKFFKRKYHLNFSKLNPASQLNSPRECEYFELLIPLIGRKDIPRWNNNHVKFTNLEFSKRARQCQKAFLRSSNFRYKRCKMFYFLLYLRTNAFSCSRSAIITCAIIYLSNCRSSWRLDGAFEIFWEYQPLTPYILSKNRRVISGYSIETMNQYMPYLTKSSSTECLLLFICK